MDDLIPTNPAKPVSLSDCRISTGLWAKLSSNLPAEVELAAIAADPALLAEARTTVKDLAIVAAPCGDETVRRLLQELVLVMGVGEAAKTKAFWKVYYDQLSGLPASALEQAVKDYAGGENSEFFPKPGPLKALAMRRAEPIYKALSRAKRAAKMAPAPKVDRGTAEERKHQVAQLLKGFNIPSRDPGATA